MILIVSVIPWFGVVVFVVGFVFVFVQRIYVMTSREEIRDYSDIIFSDTDFFEFTKTLLVSPVQIYPG